MKAFKAKYLLVAAGVCLLSIVALGYYFFLTDFSAKTETQFVYVDDDDTIDSVLTKLRPIATEHGLTGFGTLIRHTDYAKTPRTGRYAIEPEESTWEVMRKLKNGQQQAVMLTVPESRTVKKLAAALSRKLMMDSVEIAAPSSTRSTASAGATTPAPLPPSSSPTPMRFTGT